MLNFCGMMVDYRYFLDKLETSTSSDGAASRLH